MARRFVVRGFRLKDGKTTTVALEAEVWDMLREICEREGTSIKQIIEVVDRSNDGAGRASGLRVYVLLYFREKARLKTACLGL